MRTFKTFLIASAVLLAGAAVNPLSAQTDVIRGRVTDIDGSPLADVRVTATSIPGNVTRTVITNAQGRFQLAFPGGPGDYIMGYSLVGYAYRQFQIKRLADEDVLVADTRLSIVQIDTLMVEATRQQRVNRNQQTPDISGTEQPIPTTALPPELQGDIAAMAASLPGVVLLPGLEGEPDGFSVLGLGADQNNVTINGLQAGANNLPRDAGVSTSLTTSPYDVSRGGFSGANFNIRSRSGSNFRSRGMSMVFTTPQMQWTDRAARSLGNDFTNVSLGGVASGPIKQNKSFYNVSYQVGRQARDYQTLLNTSPLGLQTAGIARDSVSRFIGILNGYGIPTAVGDPRSNRYNDNASVFGSIDVSPPGSSSGQSFGLTFNGNWRRQAPSGNVNALALESAAGNRTNWSAGLQARHSGYLGMILTESSAGVNLTRSADDAYLDLPSGRVRVNSTFEDGGNGVQSLSFGGNQLLGFSSRSVGATFQNNLSWFDDANKHRIKLTTELSYSGSTDEQGSNLLGTFTFQSLEDLQAGRPASFTRTLTARERTNGAINASIAIGDSYRRTPDLQFQYGVRLDANRYTEKPEYNALIESTYGRRNDRVPTPVAISPRIGFSWTVGRLEEVASFVGAARTPRAVIRGGIGIFANSANAGQINSALINTGLPSGVQQIVCVGPAVPIPNWTVYDDDPSAVPDRCADGTTGSVFSNSAPDVTVFAEDFAPQKTLRGNLSWNGSVLDARYNVGVEGTYSHNMNQQYSVDLNFQPEVRFNLADEGRPVFVETSSIVSTTGATATRNARVSQSFARVNEVRSDLESRTVQLSFRLSPIQRGITRFSWSAAYTYTHVREQISGFSSTAGNPLSIDWSRSRQGPHSINYSLRYRFFDAVDVNWTGSFRSGTAFTPMVAGDINGDGYSNDRAFVFDPSNATDATLAEGMRQLLSTTSGNARECLEKQLGKIADLNSCRGPWTSTASLSITLDRAKFRMPNRAAVSLSLSNPLGAADLAVNGSGNLKGWGQTVFPEQSLLYVRGFDATTRRYRYEVNERFGDTRPRFVTLRAPVTLSASVKIDLGPTRERQQLVQQLSSGRTQGGSRMPESFIRLMSATSVLNPLAAILRSQDSLRLTAMQADSIAAMNRRYTYRADSLWTPVAKQLAALPADFDNDVAYDLYISARRAQVDMLAEIAGTVRKLLTPEQRRKLPPPILNQLDPRYLALIRNGTGMYVGAGGGGPMGFDFPMGGFEGPVVIRSFQ